MNQQEIILGIILLVCVAWIIRRTVLCFKRIRQGSNPCEGCSCGCTKHERSCPSEKK